MNFQNFSIDTANRVLWVQGKEAVIGSRAFDVLLALAERYGQVVSKHSLLSRAWPGLVVEENNLQVQIATLRKILGKDTITTVSGRGYCLTQNRVAPGASGASDSAVSDTLAHTVAKAHGESTTLLTLGPSQALVSHMPQLYGRDQDMAVLSHLLDTYRLVTLTGSGGVGKTHLASSFGMEKKSSFKDGVFLLQAESCHDLHALTQAALLCLGVSTSQDLSGDASQCLQVIQELCRLLQHKQLLLIVDNCEQVLDDTRTFLTALLEGLPQLWVLTTSQVPLQLPQEHVYQLGTLALPEAHHSPEQMRQSGAMQLFVGRLQQLHQRFANLEPEEWQLAATICRQLDGLALALVLAAARVPLLGLHGVSEHLSDCMDLLESNLPEGQAPKRHVNLRSVIDWTYRLLEPEQAQAFRRLSLLVGSFDLATASRLLAGDDVPLWRGLKLLEGLLNHGLLTVADDGSERYRLLQPHRLYALEKLQENQELADWQRHFAQCMLACSDGFIRQRQTHTFWAELPHINAALEWACTQQDDAGHELAVALAVNTAMLLLVGSRASQALQNLQKVAPWVQKHPSPQRVAKYWQWLGRCGVHGRLPTSQCIDAMERAKTIYTQLRSFRHVHACERMLAESHLGCGNLQAAKEAIAAAQALEDAQTTVADSMRRLRVQALVAHKSGDLEMALGMLQNALSMAQMANIERYELNIALDIARLHIERGSLQESLEVFNRLKNSGHRYFFHQLTLGMACADWVAALLKIGQWERAAEVCLFALPYWERSGIFARHGDLWAWWLAGAGHGLQAVHMMVMADRFFTDREIERDLLAQQIRQQAMQAISHALPDTPFQDMWGHAHSAPMPQTQLARYLEKQVRICLTPPGHE